MNNIDTENPDEQEEVEEEQIPQTPEPPVVEQPKYTAEDVQAMVRNYLSSEEAKKRDVENRELYEKLYEEDKEEYARRKHDEEELANEKAKLKESVATEYYTDLFKNLAPRWQPYLSSMTDEEKRYFNPLNPQWTSDADYLDALTAQVAEMQAAERYREWAVGEEENIAELAVNVINGRRPVIDIPPVIEGAPISPLSRNSRDTLSEALKKTVGVHAAPGGWDDDDSD